MDDNVKTPTQEQVRLIFKYTYLIYTKYKGSTTNQEFESLRKECLELEKQYPFPLCHNILMDLLNIIEGHFKERGE